MDLMSLVTGGAQPQPGFSENFGQPQAPDLESILRAIAVEKMKGENGVSPKDMSSAPLPGPSAAPATDLGGASRRVPLPRPDPRDSMAAEYTRPDALPDFPIGQPSMGDMLPTPGQKTANTMINALGAGMAGGNPAFAGGAFGKGFSGAVAGAQASRNRQFDDSVKVLDRIRQAAARGDELGYKAALADYYRALADKARRDPSETGRGTAPTRSTERERLIDRFKAAHKERTGEDLDDIGAWEILRRNPDVAARIAAQDEATRNREAGANARAGARIDAQNLTRNPPAFEDRLKQSRQQQGLDEQGRRAQPQEKPLDQPKKPQAYKFGGEGTQANPATPKVDADYNELPIGAYYQHPADPPGKLRIKGKGPV